MFAFVARQPILDREKEVFAYELQFRDGKNNCFPDIAGADEKRQLLTKDSLKLSLDDISCQKTSFISFDKETLVNGLPSSLDPKNVVVEIDKTVASADGLMDACKNIKNMGFQLAMDDPDFQLQANEFLSLVDIIKVDVSNQSSGILKQNFEHLVNSDIKLVADRVDNQSDFVTFKDLGFDYFQGYFFSKPEAFTHRQLPTSKLSLVELIGETSNESFDLERINHIIERDVGLSYMLLRFINNPMVNKRYKITSLRHAITYMGEVEVKKFIALLALANLSDDKPMELMHMSLVRAKFCDLIAQEKKVGDNPPTGFMVGLFSLLDALLDQEMKELVAKMPIVDEVKYALCGGQNDFYLYLILAKAFESATWMKVKKIADMISIDQKRLHALFNQSILWGNGVRQSISPHFPKPVLK